MLKKSLLILISCFMSFASYAMSQEALRKELNNNVELKAALSIENDNDIAQIKALEGGLSGDAVYLISLTSDIKFVVKAFSLESERRYVEIKHQKLAGEQGLSAKVIYTNPNETMVVMAYLPKKHLPKGNQPESLAEFLRQLHGTETRFVHKKVNTFPMIKDNRMTIEQAAVTQGIDKQLLVTLEKVLQFEYQPILKLEPTFSHNDLNPGNVFYHEGRTVAIDWASSGLNDPFYDVATISNWFFQRPEEQLAFLKTYLKREPTADEKIHFFHMQSLAKCVTGSFLMADAIRMGLPEKLPKLKDLPPLPEFLKKIGQGEIKMDTSLNKYTFGAILIHDAGKKEKAS